MVANGPSPQAFILIPRNKLNHLLGSSSDIDIIVTFVMDDQRNHPRDVGVRVDMLELMNKVLDSGSHRLPGFANLESAWNLKDIPQSYSTLHRRQHYPEGAPKTACHPGHQITHPSSSELERMVRKISFSSCLSLVLK